MDLARSPAALDAAVSTDRSTEIDHNASTDNDADAVGIALADVVEFFTARGNGVLVRPTLGTKDKLRLVDEFTTGYTRWFPAARRPIVAAMAACRRTGDEPSGYLKLLPPQADLDRWATAHAKTV